MMRVSLTPSPRGRTSKVSIAFAIVGEGILRRTLNSSGDNVACFFGLKSMVYQQEYRLDPEFAQLNFLELLFTKHDFRRTSTLTSSSWNCGN